MSQSLNICANHYTKILVNHVYTYFQSETNSCKTVEMKRNDVIDWICLLFNAESSEDVEIWFKIFSVILLSPYRTVETKYAISTMKDKVSKKTSVMSTINCRMNRTTKAKITHNK